ncbi:hypothetical protein MBLNU459_g2345t1 [Dothideomycetes sp. NU459]
MSKRLADSQGGALRYGANERPDTPDDPPKKATAAQLAKRKYDSLHCNILLRLLPPPPMPVCTTRADNDSIKPLKGRTTSRSTSPSKMAPPMPNVFGGGDVNSSVFGQSAPQPPSASSFSFGGQAAQPASNPFASQSQSFPPAQAFGAFGASQPAPAVNFSAPSSFNFGASTPSPAGAFAFGASPAKPQEPNAANGASNAATNGFSFGAGAQTAGFPSPAKQTSAAGSGAFNPFGSIATSTNVFGQSQPQSQSISDAEIAEIEGAGPRLSQEGRLAELENIVRTSDPKYKDASLAGLNLKELPAEAQKKMLEFVRSPSKPEPPKPASPAFSFSAAAAATTPSKPSFSFGASTTTAPSTDTAATANPASGPSFSAFPGFGAASGASTPTSPFGSKPPQVNGTASQNDTPVSPASAPSSNMFQFKPASPASSSVFGAKRTEPNAPSSAFSFGSAKPAEEVSYPKLNIANTTPDEASAAANPFANIARSTPSTPAQPKPTKPAGASNAQSGLGSSIFGAASPSQPSQSSTIKFGATPAPASQSSAATPFKADNTKADNTAASFKGFNAPAATTPQPSNPPQSSFKSFSSATPNAPKSVSFAPSPQPSPAAPNMQQSTSSPATPQLPAASSSKMQQLNVSFRHHLAAAKVDQDWGHIVRHFLDQRSKILNDVSLAAIPDPTAGAAQTSAAPAPNNKRKSEQSHDISDDKRSKGSTSPQKEWSSPAKPMTKTAELFNEIMSSPGAATKQQNSAPDNASATSTNRPAAPVASANPFANIQRNSSSPAKEAPKPVASGFQFQAPPSATGQSPATKPAAASSPFKFTPAAPSSTPAAAPAFSIPKFGASTGGSGTVNFMSAFGKQAAAEEKKEREKRKLEDMDSDDDEEEWERKDAEEQAAKKQKLQEQLKAQQVKFVPGKGFVSAAEAETVTEKATAAEPTKSSETAGGSVFSSSVSATPQANIFGHLSGAKQSVPEDDSDGEDDDVHEALKKASPAKPVTPGKSLFDRVERDSNGDLLKDKAAGSATTPFKFGGGSVFGASTSPAGDNTWKGQENTPIKFGASAVTGSTTPEGSPAKATGNFGGFSTGGFSSLNKPTETPKFNFGGTSDNPAKPVDGTRPFAGLFGGDKSAAVEKPAAASTTSIFASNSASPSVGFQFGGPKIAPASATSSVFASAGTSRASTPGATTDADNSGNDSTSAAEPSEKQDDPQQTDLTALTPEELAESDVLHEGRAIAKQFNKNSDPTWTNKGTGPFRLLKNKETGKLRILMRAAPSGRVILNTNVLPTKGLFTNKGKMAQIMAVGEDGKSMETWILSMGNKDGEAKVKDFLEILHTEIGASS